MKWLFLALQYCLPHHLLSRFTGWVASSTSPWLKNRLIRWFIRRYHVDMREAQRPNPEDFASFNEFFTRPLRPEARKVDTDAEAIVSPADGIISAIGSIHSERVFQAKGIDYSLESLLAGDASLAARFENGQFATIYLAPRDYHRFHMPLTGKLEEMTYVPGRLFSVNPVTTQHVPGLFTRNERAICVFECPAGTMAVILVGAMIVASIETVWAGQVTPGSGRVTRQDYQDVTTRVLLGKGEEMGRFRLGSTVIMLFGPDQVDWVTSLTSGSRVQVGERMGRLRHPPPAD